MFRLIRFQNFTEYINGNGLTRADRYRHYVQHYDYLIDVILLRSQRYCGSKSDSGNDSTSASSGMTPTTTTGKDDNTMKAENKPSTNKTSAVIARRRKYLRDVTRSRYRSEDNKAHKASLKGPFKSASSTSISPNVHDALPKTNTELPTPKTTIQASQIESNQNEKTSIAKKELPVNQVHIEYMESNKKNVTDIMKPSKSYNRDQKKDEKEAADVKNSSKDYIKDQKKEETAAIDISPLKKLEKQINDPMLIKLIIRSQLVPTSTESDKSISGTTQDKMDKNNKDDIDNVKDSKTNIPSGTQKQSKSNTIEGSNKQASNTKNSPDIQESHAKNDNVKLVNNMDNTNKNEANFSKIHTILLPKESNMKNVSKNVSKKQEVEQIYLKSQETETSIEKIAIPEKPLVKHFSKYNQNIGIKKTPSRSTTEEKVFKNARSKTFNSTKHLPRIQKSVNNWYANKVEKIKRKVIGSVNTTAPKAAVTTEKKVNTKITAKTKENKLEPYHQILMSLNVKLKRKSLPDKDRPPQLEGYKDQATKLAEIMSPSINNNVLNETSSEQKKGGIGVTAVGGGGSNNGGGIGSATVKHNAASVHYARGQYSKGYTYFRNLCYILMTVIGSYTVYYTAEILSHDEADTMFASSDWPVQDTTLPFDDDNENEPNMENTNVQPLEINSEQKQENNAPVFGNEKDTPGENDDQIEDDDDDYGFHLYKKCSVYLGEESF